MKRVDCHFMLSGEMRRGYLVGYNKLTAWVKPYSRHPACVHLNSLQTKIIKRHIIKHHVTINMAHRTKHQLHKLIMEVVRYERF